MLMEFWTPSEVITGISICCDERTSLGILVGVGTNTRKFSQPTL